jgi:hypothetical protein
MRPAAAAALAVALTVAACSDRQGDRPSSEAAVATEASQRATAPNARDVGYACGITADLEERRATGAEAFVGLTLDEANAKAAQDRLTVRFEGEDGACRKLPPPPTLPSVVRVYLVDGRIAVAAQPVG